MTHMFNGYYHYGRYTTAFAEYILNCNNKQKDELIYDMIDG